MKLKTLALFDFDGTITSTDTLFEMAKFTSTKATYWANILLLIPVFVLAKFTLISKQKAKELFLNRFYGRMSHSHFDSLCREFCISDLPGLLRYGALEKIKSLQSEQATIYVVSASPENWIIPWANIIGVKVIATKLDRTGDTVSGRIDGINCNHQEKVNRIEAELDLSAFDHIIAFGDTSGDHAMLELSNEKHFKPFR